LNEIAEQSLLWRIGGAQGHGIDSAALLFARGCAKLGYNVLSRREFHSNIMGRHSYSDARVSSLPVSGHSATPDMLVCLDAESLCRHINLVNSDGCIVIDEADTKFEFSKLKLLDERLKNRLATQLSQSDQNSSYAGFLASIAEKNITIANVPFGLFRDALKDKFSVSRSVAARSKNIAIVAVSAALLDIPENILRDRVTQLFPGKQSVIELGQMAIQLAYEYVKTTDFQLQRTLQNNVKTKEPRLWVNGYQSVALGKLAAGLNLQTYYPISPATDESLYLESILVGNNRTDTSLVQTEDEIAAITMACGAALTGARVATSTSGPGFSLMVEGLGWAGMNEVPLVISLYQRGGPSTGMPTRTEQGDLQFVINAGHGEFPRIVLASGDVNECFYDAFNAFNYADRYQLPVIHMLDKTLSSTSQTLTPFDSNKLKIQRVGADLSIKRKDKRVSRFQLSDTGISPRTYLGTPDTMFWTTGVEHSEWGQVSEDPIQRAAMMEKRAHKLELAAKEIPLDEKLAIYGDKKASLTIISWGSNKGVIVETVDRLINQGNSVRAIMVKLLWPFPTNELKKIVDKNDTVIVIECNQTGQFNRLLKEQLHHQADHLILKYTGRPFTLEEISQSMQDIMAGQADNVITHQNPFE